LNPLAVEAMAQTGIDISQNKTKSVFEMWKSGEVFQYVIAVCDAESAEKCSSDPQILEEKTKSKDESQNNQINMFIAVNKEIDRIAKDLIKMRDNSASKVFYEYLYNLKLEDGSAAVNSIDFLKDQLDKLDNLELLSEGVVDRKLGDAPNLSKELRNLKALPPGILRSLPEGMNIWVVLNVIQRAIIVINYFLKILVQNRA
jgi:hypothetical protein